MDQTATRPIAVTDADFGERVIQSDQPVLVDFWAEWCAPCRALGPIVETLAGDYSGRARIAKVDVDASPELAMRYGVRSIPTVILFDNGQVVDTFVGVRPKADYAASLDKLVA